MIDSAADGAATDFKIDASDETFAFRPLSFDRDDEVTASQIAERFGAHPVSQFKILQQLDTGEIETKPSERDHRPAWRGPRTLLRDPF